jgi:predicted dinucleotide-binding enzyme
MGRFLGWVRLGKERMRIWIIGSDPVARALARSWTQAGHEVLFTFSFDRTDCDALTAETGGRYATLAEGASVTRFGGGYGSLLLS